jgi:glyoxylase-like metal-dependent hydrolase (beta-lactamase superfamily II)
MSARVVPVPTDYSEAADARLDLYLIVDDGRAVLIDAGIASTPSAGATAIIRRELAGATLDAVLLTHAHVDHVGGSTALRAEFGCRILVPRADLVWAQQPERQWDEFWATCGDLVPIEDDRTQILEWSGPAFAADGALAPGDVVPVGAERIRAVHTGAHTPGHTCYLAEHDGTLFTGDYVQARGNRSDSGSTVFLPLYDSVADYLAGLDALAALPFTRLATAHRGILDRTEGLDLIEQSRAFTREASALTAALHAAGQLTDARLAAALSALAGAASPYSVQSVLTARAHIRDHAARGAADPEEEAR